MFGIFGKRGSKGKPWYERGGRPKPTRLPSSYKEWRPPVKESTDETPAASTANPES